jgi:hypothetical protein
MVDDDGVSEEDAASSLTSVLALEDDADVVVDWLVAVAVGALAGALAGAAAMENRGDDISSSPSQLPPKGMKRSTRSFESFT